MSKDYFSSQGLTGFDFHDALCIRKDVYFHPFLNFHYIAVSASQTDIGKNIVLAEMMCHLYKVHVLYLSLTAVVLLFRGKILFYSPLSISFSNACSVGSLCVLGEIYQSCF